MTSDTLAGRRTVRVVVAGGPPLLQGGIVAALTAHPQVRCNVELRSLDACFTIVAGPLAGPDRASGDGPISVPEDLYGATACDVLILLTPSPRRDCASAVAGMARWTTAPRLLILTDNDDIDELVATIGAGADGYGQLTGLCPDDLRTAVLALDRHGSWLCPTTVTRLVRATRARVDTTPDVPTGTASSDALSPLSVADPGQATARDITDLRRSARGPLSDREMEVLRLLAARAGEQEIATRLHLTRNTVKTYLKRISEKLGVTSRSEALCVAIARGLVPDRRNARRPESGSIAAA